MFIIRIAAAAAAFLLLSGCSSDPEPSSSDPDPAATSSAASDFDAPVRGLPDGVAENTATTAGAGLSDDGQLWIVTYGSSTNPFTVDTVSVEDQTVTVTLAQRDGPATMDLVPTTTTIPVPAGVDTDSPLTIMLDELGSVTVDPTAPGRMAWLPAE